MADRPEFPVSVPDEFALVTDTAIADWVGASLIPWDQDGVRVSSVIPDSFDAYARIPHPREDGCLPREKMQALVRVLEEFTSGLCLCCFWEGWGDWTGGSILTSGAGVRRWLHDWRETRSQRANERVLRRIPMVRTPGRSYLLFRGPLASLPSFNIDSAYRSPSLWWPDGRTWCVATEIDDYSTYVGGHSECVGRVLDTTSLEAVQASADARLV